MRAERKLKAALKYHTGGYLPDWNRYSGDMWRSDFATDFMETSTIITFYQWNRASIRKCAKRMADAYGETLPKIIYDRVIAGHRLERPGDYEGEVLDLAISWLAHFYSQGENNAGDVF